MRLQQVREAEYRGRIRDAGRPGVAPDECPVHRHVMQRVLDRLVGQREPLLQEVEPRHHEHRAWSAIGRPGRRVWRNPGDEGVSRHDRQNLLQEHLLARPLGGSLETAGETQLVLAPMIPGREPPPLPFAVNPQVRGPKTCMCA